MLFDLNPLAQVNGMVKKYGTIFLIFFFTYIFILGTLHVSELTKNL